MAQRTQGLSVLTIFQYKKKVELLNQTFTKGQAVILNLSWSLDYPSDWSISHICQFWYHTTTLFRPVKSRPKMRTIAKIGRKVLK